MKLSTCGKRIKSQANEIVAKTAYFVDSLVQDVWRFVGSHMNARMRRYTYIFMFVLFISGIGLIFYKDPAFLGRIEPWPLLLLSAVVPLRLTANAVRYTVLARFADQPMKLSRAFSIVIAGNAANFLPLPGGLLVRAAGLSQQGQGYTKGLAVNVAGSLVWVGIAGIFASLGAYYLSMPVAGTVLVTGGGVAFALGTAQLSYWKPQPWLILALLGANLIFCVLATLRFAFSLMAIGLGLQIARSVLLSVSGPLGVITALAPGALGVSEAIATALGVASGLGATETFGAAAIIRIVSLSVLACISLAIGYFQSTSKTST